ncbi:hypothetical protein HZY97_02095 [Sphingomonas sp. R-74633]|uniref:hypothetical protein n=1 Tax=Sphingomonas sp. R-74633 TaxID=2751188 RepID=UPI0015D3B441|nr:hypothetical protein [Sphingomonas sp. R-74633]NYT39533.1 hypothetical protein [Sphingomonas sp. R-74633]
MNPLEMVVAIVLIVTIASVIKARYGIHKDQNGNEVYRGGPADTASAAENARLKDEIRALKERVQVLERVVTDTDGSVRLDREIESLRDKN